MASHPVAPGRGFLFALCVALPMVLGACRGQPSGEPPVVVIRNMHDQPRYDPQAGSGLFEDGRAMRPLPKGTLPREAPILVEVAHGTTETGDWVLEIPRPVVARAGGPERLVQRGQQRYGIYCAPCHGAAGDGKGVVSVRAAEVGAAALQATTLHDERIRHIPDGQLFGTISNGIRNMPAYRHSIPTEDRWAIVAFVRALQLTQSKGLTP